MWADSVPFRISGWNDRCHKQWEAGGVDVCYEHGHVPCEGLSLLISLFLSLVHICWSLQITHTLLTITVIKYASTTADWFTSSLAVIRLHRGERERAKETHWFTYQNILLHNPLLVILSFNLCQLYHLVEWGSHQKEQEQKDNGIWRAELPLEHGFPYIH